MSSNHNILYKTTTTPLLKKCGLPGVIASNDLSIIRLYLSKDDSDNKVFSKTIFLCKYTHDLWRKKEEKILFEKIHSPHVLKKRYLQGLELVEDYFVTSNPDMDSKETLLKVRGFLVNSENNETMIKTVNSKTIPDLKKILGKDAPISNTDFSEITNNFFEPESVEIFFSDFVLIQDTDIARIDEAFRENFSSKLYPKNSSMDTRFFSTEAEKTDFISTAKSSRKTFSEYKKIKLIRIKKLISEGYFDKFKKEILSTTKDYSVTEGIIKTIEDNTKTCFECNGETTSTYCENINCKSIVATNTFYSIYPDYDLNLLLSDSFSFTSPFTALAPLNNSEKETVLCNAAKSFENELHSFINENQHDISIDTYNIADYRWSKSTPKNTISKTAIFKSGKEIEGTNIVFWGFYKTSESFYGIIQHEDEIKTPSLFSAARKTQELLGKRFSHKLSEDFYKNKILYIEADNFGQIIKCREGFIDFSNPNTPLLSLSVNQFSEIIAVRDATVYPNISRIMFRDKKTPSIDNFNLKGAFLRPLLNIDNLTNNELSNKPTDYSFSKGCFYHLSKGDIVYESKNKIHSFSDKKVPSTIGNGNIDIFSIISLKDAISNSDFLKEKSNLLLSYIKGFMLNPNKSSEGFYDNYLSKRHSLFDKAENSANKKHGIVRLFDPKYQTKIINKLSQITIPSTFKNKKYPANLVSAYRVINCTPFMLKELSMDPLVDLIELTIHKNQGKKSSYKINVLTPPSESFSTTISDFVPLSVHLGSTDNLTIKNTLTNGLGTIGYSSPFTISLNISLSKSITTYELAVFEKYLEQNGISSMNKTQPFLPISINTSDLISLIL